MNADPAPHAPSTLAWWVRVLIALGFLGLLVVDPLNAGSASSQRSEQALLRIVSPFYRPSGKVTVILIDDAYLERHRSGWPMSYGEQGLLLRRILALEPAAVFVDLLYRHRHSRASGPSDDDPRDLIVPLASATDARVPVLFAVLSKEPASGFAQRGCTAAASIDIDSIEPSLREGFGIDGRKRVPPATGPRLDVARVGWSGCGASYPLVLGGDVAALTPAMAMFQRACESGLTAPGCGALTAKTAFGAFDRPMLVRWGAYAPLAQAPFDAEGVCQRYEDPAHPPGMFARVGLALRQFALGAITDLRSTGDPALALPCPALPVIRADAVADADEAQVRALVKGKVVFVGAQISGIPDWIQSPVHGQVPGVLLHAMAADNLLARGSGYTKPMPHIASRLIMVLLAGMVAVLAPQLVGRKPMFRETSRAAIGAILWVGYAVVLALHGQPLQAAVVLCVGGLFDLMKPLETFRYLWLILAMAVLAALALWTGWSPWNWIGLAFVVIATQEAFRPYLKPAGPKPFPHPASLLRRLAPSRRPIP